MSPSGTLAVGLHDTGMRIRHSRSNEVLQLDVRMDFCAPSTRSTRRVRIVPLKHDILVSAMTRRDVVSCTQRDKGILAGYCAILRHPSDLLPVRFT